MREQNFYIHILADLASFIASQDQRAAKDLKAEVLRLLEMFLLKALQHNFSEVLYKSLDFFMARMQIVNS